MTHFVSFAAVDNFLITWRTGAEPESCVCRAEQFSRRVQQLSRDEQSERCSGVTLAVAVGQLSRSAEQIETNQAQGGGYKFRGYYQTHGLINWDEADQKVVPSDVDRRLLIFLVCLESWGWSLCLLSESYAKHLLQLSSSWSIQVGVWSPFSRKRKLERTCWGV